MKWCDLLVVILQCTDPLGRVIVVEEDQWNDHIIDHPELVNQLASVQQTLTNPYCVTHDRMHMDREVFYLPFILPTAPMSYLKVCVEFSPWSQGKQNDGVVITAYSVDQVHPKEKQKWP